MKIRRPHRAPPAPRAVAILHDLHAITGKGRFVFPSVRSNKRCMSESTINAALRPIGLQDRRDNRSPLQVCGLVDSQ
jgi:hypothetical protein